MERVPFRKEELKVIGTRPGPFPGSPGSPIFDSPISEADNYRMLMRGETPLWMPDTHVLALLAPRCIPDSIARGMVIPEGGTPADITGGFDMFGTEWVFEPKNGGSMQKPGPHLVPDICEWEKYVTFPDIETWDWEGSAKELAPIINDPNTVTAVFFMTGMFERLVSFVGMEDALCAMIDEDEQEDVKRLFDRLCDFYDGIFAKLKQYFQAEIVFFHDDWGTQRAPFFSADTVRDMLLPYIKRIGDSLHRHGMLFELHSCGKNETLVPLMIEAGADSWNAQPINDFKMLNDKYGDQFHFEVTAPFIPADATDEEIYAAAQKTVEDYPNKRCTIVTGNPMHKPEVTQKFQTALYECSRIAYCGKAE